MMDLEDISRALGARNTFAILPRQDVVYRIVQCAFNVKESWHHHTAARYRGISSRGVPPER